MFKITKAARPAMNEVVSNAGEAPGHVVARRPGGSVLKRFSRETAGNVGMIFAAMILPISALLGMSLDFGRAYNQRTQMQLTLDSAVLAAGREFDNTGDVQAAEAAGARYFEKALSSEVAATITRNEVDAQGNVRMTAKASVETTFLRMMGSRQLDVAVDAESLVKDSGGMDVELAVIFDVTGSMGSNNKLQTAKQAANDLLDILLPHNVRANSVKISLVPFSSMVNVGDMAGTVTGEPATKTEQQTDWYWDTETYCSRYYNNGSCRTWSTRNYKHYYTYDVTYYRQNCVYERSQSQTGHAFDDEPPTGDGSYFKANWSTSSNPDNCTPNYHVIPLTNDVESLRDAIDGMQDGGNTAGHLGLAWGWYTISERWSSLWPSGHGAEPKDPENLLKAVIIMTDGEFNQRYVSGNGDSDTQALQVCGNMKDDGVEVFAVGVEISQSAREMLLDCVSEPNNLFEQHYYDVINSRSAASGLRTAFREIADNIASATGTGNVNLRLTR